MVSPVHQEMNSSLLSALTLNREIMVSPVHQEMNLPLLAAPMLWLCHLLTKRWTHHCYQLWHSAVIHSPRDELTTAISTDMVVSSAGRDWLIIAIGITHSTQRPADRQWWVICRQRLTHHSNRNHTQRPADRQWQVICRQPTHHWRNHRTDSPTDSHLLAHRAIHPPLLSASLTSTELVSWAELTVSTSTDSMPDWLASISSSTDDCTPRVQEGFERQNSSGFE